MSYTDDIEYEPDVEDEILTDHSGNVLWITKDKRRIRIIDMKTDHINNIVKMLKHKYGNKLAEIYITIFEEELELRKNKNDQ